MNEILILKSLSPEYIFYNKCDKFITNKEAKIKVHIVPEFVNKPFR